MFRESVQLLSDQRSYFLTYKVIVFVDIALILERWTNAHNGEFRCRGD